jgi:hypothetical protein
MLPTGLALWSSVRWYWRALAVATVRPRADQVADMLDQCVLLTSLSTAQPQLLPLDLLQVLGLQPHLGRP